MTDTHGTADMVTTATPTDPRELLAGHVKLVQKLATRAARRRGLDPDDLASRALLRGVRFLHKFDPSRGSMGAWLGAVIRSEASHLAGYMRAHPEHRLKASHLDDVAGDAFVARDPSPPKAAHARDVADRVQAAVASLDGEERSAALRLMHDGGGIAAGAAQTGRSWQTARKAEAAARAKLRELLADLEHDRD